MSQRAATIIRSEFCVYAEDRGGRSGPKPDYKSGICVFVQDMYQGDGRLWGPDRQVQGSALGPRWAFVAVRTRASLVTGAGRLWVWGRLLWFGHGVPHLQSGVQGPASSVGCQLGVAITNDATGGRPFGADPTAGKRPATDWSNHVACGRFPAV